MIMDHLIVVFLILLSIFERVLADGDPTTIVDHVCTLSLIVDKLSDPFATLASSC
jgi:hypothetical protein